jgi:hypothetical protein
VGFPRKQAPKRNGSKSADFEGEGCPCHGEEIREGWKRHGMGALGLVCTVYVSTTSPYTPAPGSGKRQVSVPRDGARLRPVCQQPMAPGSGKQDGGLQLKQKKSPHEGGLR